MLKQEYAQQYIRRSTERSWAPASTGRQVVRAYRHNLETDYGAQTWLEGDSSPSTSRGAVAQRDLAMDREEALATTARVHARLQSDHGERATCTHVLQKRHAK